MANNVVTLHIPPRKPIERKTIVLDDRANVELLRAKLTEMGRLGYAKHFNPEERHWLTDFDVRRAVVALGFEALQVAGDTFIIPHHIKRSLEYDFSWVTDQDIDEGMAPWSYYELSWEGNLYELYPEHDYEAEVRALGEALLEQWEKGEFP